MALDYLVVVAISLYDNVTGRYEEELARVAGIGDEEALGPADGWAGLGRYRETKGSGEGFNVADSANGGRNWLVQSGELEHC